MSPKYVKLPQPDLLDFTKLNHHDEVKIIISNKIHYFSDNADPSGEDVKKNPIFGTTTFINGEKFLETSYGFPFIRFSRGSKPKITYHNKTKFTFNIHYHGLNTVGSIDGTAMELFFGNSTQLGPCVTLEFPTITNNYSMLWFHCHNMFTSIEFIHAGLFGLLQIIDDETLWLNEIFTYKNNQIFLSTLDMDLDEKGKQTSSNLITDENRSCFSIVNGLSAVNWYSKSKVPYVTPLVHKVSKNLVKIDILNAALNWRVFHIGVCDKHDKIKSFYHVQCDCSLINPKKVDMVWVPVAGRVSIIFDLNEFEDQKAYLFYYDFDLTEILGSMPTYPNEPNNESLTATVPDFNQVNNGTPYPTPIPDPGNENQQQNSSALIYPSVNLIPQISQVLKNGSIPFPQKYSIKKFLKIKGEIHQSIDLKDVIKGIRKVVFGENYETYKHIVTKSNFENELSYVSLLNKNYFYNLPLTNCDNIPLRNILLFPETNNNCISYGNVNGTTECVNGANRIMCDLWNSKELDLNWALQQYNLNPNNFKPPILPSSKFRIYKTDDRYSNTAMISNDTLCIEFFENEVSYGDHNTQPIKQIEVIFPATTKCNLMNIQEWVDLINETFDNTFINFNTYQKLSNIIECDWSFFPYTYNYLYDKSIYIKSAIIKTINKTSYFIRLSARWPLLQLFGKAMTGNTIEPNSDMLAQNKIKLQALKQLQSRKLNQSIKYHNLSPRKTPSQYMKCNEEEIYGIYDNEIEQIFPFYATGDDNVQLPIACMKRSAELIIIPFSTFIGLYDGYSNPNLWSFSTKFRSTETWNYINLDCADSHPIHFHLTSGYVTKNTDNDLSNSQTYSRDIYQIGPNQSISFDLTWPYYPSYKTTKTPHIRCLGGVIHCHFLPHNDNNSMMIQYFVEEEEKED